MKEILLDIARVTVIIVGHIAAAAVAAVGIWAFEYLFRHYLWTAQEPLLFDVLPLRYVFDAADLALLIGFIIRGMRLIMKKDDE